MCFCFIFYRSALCRLYRIISDILPIILKFFKCIPEFGFYLFQLFYIFIPNIVVRWKKYPYTIDVTAFDSSAYYNERTDNCKFLGMGNVPMYCGL